MPAAKKYQLFLQFRADSVTDYDELVALENVLIESLSSDSEVDGHDMGAGEFNIFLFTNDPVKTFHEVRKTIEAHRPGQRLRAAYRAVSSEEYVSLWPTSSETFNMA